MLCRPYSQREISSIVSLYTSVFTAAESEAEGALVGRLAKDLLEKSDAKDLYGFVAFEEQQLMGAILFSRLLFEKSSEAFILSPVAVHSDFQGKGIGQSLIRFGLDELKRAGVELVVTYGDPAFYSKLGFEPLSEELIKAPFALSQPHGWIAQSLTEEPIGVLGECSCVEALNNPALW